MNCYVKIFKDTFCMPGYLILLLLSSGSMHAMSNFQLDNKLIQAIDEGDVDWATNLLDSGANVNAVGPVLKSYPPQGGQTVLMYGLMNYEKTSNLNLITFLIQRGADPYKTQASGQDSFALLEKLSLSSDEKKAVQRELKKAPHATVYPLPRQENK